MTDEKLDQILQHALSPEISDSEIAMKKKMEVDHMKKGRHFMKPAVAAAVCAALLAGTAGAFMQLSRTDTEQGIIDEVAGDVKNAFTLSITAHAAEKKQLEKGKAAPVVSIGERSSEGWSGDDQTRETCYCISAPFVCDGKNLEKITYTINKGAFEIVQPKGKNIVLEGQECKDKDVDREGIEMENGERKYYTSFTVSADRQSGDNTYIYICGKDVLSAKDYQLLWGEKSTLQQKKQGMDAMFKDIKITCTVTYQDGTTDSAEIAVGSEVMTSKEAGFDGEGAKNEGKSVFPTYQMK